MTETTPKKILVVGGSGFVSGTLATRAIEEGHEVWALTRGQRPIMKGVHHLIADRKDHAAFAEVVASAGVTWDLVVDCIGFVPEDAKQNLAVFEPLAKQLVFISTDFVYDPAQRRVPQAEESDHYLKDGYGGQKRQCEGVFLAYEGALAWSILRPCHIYGPGSQLGCLPLHSRDPKLIAKLRAGEALQLLDGGSYLQQPVLASDLAETILSMTGNTNTFGQIFGVAGLEVATSRDYYRIIADMLGVGLEVEDVPSQAYLQEHPNATSFVGDRVYDLSKLQAAGAAVPKTPLEQGLRIHVSSLLEGEPASQL